MQRVFQTAFHVPATLTADDKGTQVPEEWRKKLTFDDLAAMFPTKGREDMVQLRADVAEARTKMAPGSKAHEYTGQLEEMLALIADTVPALVAEKKYAEALSALQKTFLLGHDIARTNLDALHAILSALTPGAEPTGPDAEALPTYSNNARGASSLMGFTAQGIFAITHSAQLPERRAAFDFLLGQYKLLLKAGGGTFTPPKPSENPYKFVASSHAGNIGALLWIAASYEADAEQKASMTTQLEALSVPRTLPPGTRLPPSPAGDAPGKGQTPAPSSAPAGP